MDEQFKIPDDMHEMFMKYPYTVMYMLQYGDVGNKWQLGPYHDLESLHKACLQQNKTWQEIVGKTPDDVLL